MRFKAVTVGLVLVGTALGSAALTLGRTRGAAWIGQPLELVVPTQLESGQTEGALCAEADVFHGDSRQEASRVQILVMPTDQPDTFNLKITSSALVDEPVVTVYLRAGCTQKSTRKYVLLADFPNDGAVPLSRSAAPLAPQVPLVVPIQPAPLQATQVAAPPQVGVPAVDAAKPPPKSTKPNTATNVQSAKVVGKEPLNNVGTDAAKEATPKKESSTKPVQAAQPAPPSKPRLRLDPIETLSERVKTLESTTAPATSQDNQARDVQKMEALQGDLKMLLEQATKNEASLLAMRERLEKAESDRVPVIVVYALAAMVALCLCALVFLWGRRPANIEQDDSGHAIPRSGGGDGSAQSSQLASNNHQEIDIDLVDMDDESFDRLLAQTAAKK